MSEITRIFRQCDTPGCSNTDPSMLRCCACDRDVCWSHQRKVISVTIEAQMPGRQEWPASGSNIAGASVRQTNLVLCPACIPDNPAYGTVIKTLEETLRKSCELAVREALVIARIGLPAPEKEKSV